MGILDHLTCLLRNLNMQVKKQQNWTWNNELVPNWERSTSRLYIVTLLIYYAEYIMKNVGLAEAQAEIKIARRNINNLRYANVTTVMEESEEELKSLLKSCHKSQHSKN